MGLLQAWLRSSTALSHRSEGQGDMAKASLKLDDNGAAVVATLLDASGGGTSSPLRISRQEDADL